MFNEFSKFPCNVLSRPDKNRETERQTDRQTDRQTNRQTDRQTDKQTHRQTKRPTHGVNNITPLASVIILNKYN